ncbi:DEKNAAC104285 [Brettanomyces naardenensis]|uniref:DEKNAAC104285 n=1 Tax=Brettanomyces naardenensis TaxID=13370 RepID=A0A448YQ94_BRENA|nr:DEKNAAC104285 [Brettanomyces naardenensis]
MAILLERDVYCLDLRNHGDSPHSERMDYPALSADVERFIGEHKLEQPILIGHSMGAKTAMAVCLRKPKLCSLLVPVDNAPVDLTGGGAGFSKFGTYVKQMEKIDGNHKLTSLKDCDKILAEVEPNKTIRQFLLTNMKPDDEGGYRCRVPLDIMEKTLDNISAWPFNYEISRWNGPALFVRGTKSPYLADEYLESVAKFFPRFEIRDVESGHWVTSENPSAFVGAVSEWIRYQESD